MMDALTPEEFAHTLRSTRRGYAEAVDAAEAKVAKHVAMKRFRGEEDSKLLTFFRATLTYMRENPEQFV